MIESLLPKIFLTLCFVGVIFIVLEEFFITEYGSNSKLRYYSVKIAGWLFSLAILDAIAIVLIEIWK
jgi:hypothetical protein